MFKPNKAGGNNANHAEKTKNNNCISHGNMLVKITEKNDDKRRSQIWSCALNDRRNV